MSEGSRKRARSRGTWRRGRPHPNPLPSPGEGTGRAFRQVEGTACARLGVTAVGHPRSEEDSEGPDPAGPTARTLGPDEGMPTAPREIRELLRGLGLRPLKGFGQNFLTSEAVLGRIVDAAEVEPEDL